MNSYRQNRKKAKHAKHVLVYITVLVLAVGALDVASSGKVRFAARAGVAAVFEFVQTFSWAAHTVDIFKTRAQLISENDTLKQHIRDTEAAMVSCDIAYAENDSLRGLLNMSSDISGKMAARVVSSSESSPFSTIVIKTDGGRVEEGDYVIAGDSIAVGYVIENDESTALVRLFTAPGEHTEVQVRDTAVVMDGGGSGNGMFSIPREVDIAENDVVFLAGSRFAVGRVGRIEKTPADALQKVLVYVPINIDALRFIYISER